MGTHDASLGYWTAALALMALMAASAAVGVGRARRGDLAGHRQAMLCASALVVLFVASYGVKLGLLGREDFSLWSERDRWILRVHESCVALMLAAGGLALWRGRRLARTRLFTPSAPTAPLPWRRSHRLAGRTALVAAGLGLASAALVLAGMYERAGY